MRVYAAALVLVASFAADQVLGAKEKQTTELEGAGNLVDQNGVGVRGRKQEEEGGEVIPDVHWSNEGCPLDGSFMPSIMCPPDITLYADGACEATVGTPSPAINAGNCGLDSITCTGGPTDYENDAIPSCANTVQGDPIDGPCFAGVDVYGVDELGDTTITCTAMVESDTSDACHVIVTVMDKLPPTLHNCPHLLQNEVTDQNYCTYRYDPYISASDNCDQDVHIQTTGEPANNQFPLGATSVSATATDDSGNTASCDYVVVVTDDQDPTAKCPYDVTGNTDHGKCFKSNVHYDIDCHDNCDDYDCTEYDNGPDNFPLGSTKVDATVTDKSGNMDSCDFYVVITDDQDPDAMCSDITLKTDQGECSSTDSIDSAASSTDNCAVVSEEFSDHGPYENGDAVVYTVADAAGRMDSCTITVTVEDHEPPTISCPPDQTRGTELNTCYAHYDATSADIIANDNCCGDGRRELWEYSSCPAVTFSGDYKDGDMYYPGTHHIIVTATDDSGNTDSCSFKLTVKDTQSPAIYCVGAGVKYTDYTELFSVSDDNCAPYESDGIKQVVCEDKHNNMRVWAMDSGYEYGHAVYEDGDLDGHGTCTAVDTSGNEATCHHAFTPTP